MKIPAFLLILLLWAGQALAEPHARVLPEPVDQGTVATVMVAGLGKTSGLAGSFDGRPIFFFSAGGEQIGLFGADVTLKAGRYPLELTWAGGRMTLEVTVRDISRGVRSITVPKKQVDLSKADLERAASEKKLVLAALETKSPHRLWRGPWVDPVKAPVTSAFGRQTRINGVLNDRPHLGTDFGAAAGTPIKAPAEGIVILTGDHFFAGRSVYLDHGQGLISMYFHLSEIKIRDGEQIKQGQILGLSGASGRVAGAHLHYGLYLNQARIDPVAFHHLTSQIPHD